MLAMPLPGFAVVEYFVREKLPDKIFSAVEKDLVVFGEEAGMYFARLVEPVFEAEQALFNLLCIFFA